MSAKVILRNSRGRFAAEEYAYNGRFIPVSHKESVVTDCPYCGCETGYDLLSMDYDDLVAIFGYKHKWLFWMGYRCSSCGHEFNESMAAEELYGMRN